MTPERNRPDTNTLLLGGILLVTALILVTLIAVASRPSAEERALMARLEAVKREVLETERLIAIDAVKAKLETARDMSIANVGMYRPTTGAAALKIVDAAYNGQCGSSQWCKCAWEYAKSRLRPDDLLTLGQRSNVSPTVSVLNQLTRKGTDDCASRHEPH